MERMGKPVTVDAEYWDDRRQRQRDDMSQVAKRVLQDIPPFIPYRGSAQSYAAPSIRGGISRRTPSSGYGHSRPLSIV
jgi:hypothetical protein